MAIRIHMLGGPLDGKSFTTGQGWFEVSETKWEHPSSKEAAIYRHVTYTDPFTGEEYYLNTFHRYEPNLE